MNKILPASGDQEHRGMAAEHRIGVGLGGNRRARNRYHEPPSAGNLRACNELPRRVALSHATPRHAVRPAYAFLEKSWPMQELRCGARRASARSQRIGANNAGRANQRCTPATVTLLVLLLGLGFDDRLACWRAPGPYLSTTTLKASVGRKPQQPVISPAKKIRPGRCGAATLRLVAANAPTASNQSTSRMGGGCKVQWTPRPRRCRPAG
jgi:hypothetical protein